MSILLLEEQIYWFSRCEISSRSRRKVIVVDNLINGHIKSVNVNYFYRIDIRDRKELDKVFSNHKVDVVIHFAANSL